MVPAPGPDLALAPRRWQPATSVALLAIHALGGLVAISTLQRAWQTRTLLQLWADLLLPFGDASFWLVMGLVGAGIPIAALHIGRILWRSARRQPERDAFLRVRVFLCVVVACVFVTTFVLSTAESFKGPFRVQHPVVADLVAAFAYVAYSVWGVALPWLRRRLRDQTRRILDLVGANAALLLVLGEVGLRTAAEIWPTPILVTDGAPSRIRREAGRLPVGELRFGFPINQDGHYDTDLALGPDAPRPLVVSIGDSFSYGVVPQAYHYTTVAERELPGAEFYNMGYPGLGPTDYLHLLEHEARALQPDLVVVQLFVGNDVAAGPEPASPPRWFDADNYLLPIVCHRLQIRQRAELAKSYAAAAPSQAELETQYPWLADALTEKPGFGEDMYAELESLRAWSVCLPHPGVFERFTGELVALERAAGDIPLAFVIIPDEFQVEDSIWQQVVARRSETLDRDLIQRKTVQWMKDRGRPCLDLLPLLRAVEPLADGRKHVYHVRDTHFNARGNAVAGRALAAFAKDLLASGEARRGGAAPSQAVADGLSLPIHLDLGAGGRRFLQSGWSHDETQDGQSYVWSEGPRSVIAIPLPQGNDVRMSFVGSPFTFPGSPEQTLSVIVDGTLTGEFTLRPGQHRYSVILPATARRGALATIELRYGYARAPREVIAGSPDRRELAFAWHSIDFTEPGQ